MYAAIRVWRRRLSAAIQEYERSLYVLILAELSSPILAHLIRISLSAFSTGDHGASGLHLLALGQHKCLQNSEFTAVNDQSTPSQGATASPMPLLLSGRSCGSTCRDIMGAAACAAGINSLTDTLAAAVPSLHELVITVPILLASLRQHGVRLCALHTLHLQVPSRSTSTTWHTVQLIKHCERICFSRSHLHTGSTQPRMQVFPWIQA